MGKVRKSKRELVRDEKRKRKRDIAVASVRAKRQRLGEPENIGEFVTTTSGLDGWNDDDNGRRPMRTPPPAAGPEREFFGHLADEEQEYFRRADELLELNDFPTVDDRDIFIENVFKEAHGKELKLASSQSCSRLMERLILLSTTQQKKHLFAAFAGHFLTLVTHRFASHCCEQLLIQSAPIVTQELGMAFPRTGEDKEKPAPEQEAAMEDLFLLTLDELENHLTSILSDKFASHTLRVILVVLSGRPLDQISTKSLLQSKKKERITVPGAPSASDETAAKARVVPESFKLATQKIIADSTSSMDSTALRVLATHPTGNPSLQLLLELDVVLNTKSKAKAAKENGVGDGVSLLERLLPEAPASLSAAESDAAAFVNSMLYDSIGSRLLETVVTHCPGKIFKALHANIFGPRIETLLRNDIASYPAIKVLNRLGKDDLVEAVHRILPTVPVLVEKGRFNVLKTLFERCQARGAEAEVTALLAALQDACGDESSGLVAKWCMPGDEPERRAEQQRAEFQQFPSNKPAMASHACNLATALLRIPGPAARTVQASLLALPPDQLPRLATSSVPAAHLLAAALRSPSPIAGFHRRIVAPLAPHTAALAASPAGHHVLLAVVAAPSRAGAAAVPFHLKETVAARLAAAETELREGWTGRSVWRAWRVDLWKRRRGEWVTWAKDVDYADETKGR